MEAHQPLEEFGTMVFGEKEMSQLLPRPVYLSWKKTIANDGMLDLPTANAIATAMKQWAIERGATHFTHWLQPLGDTTAEKHFSFVEPSDEGVPFIHLSGKMLIKGEEDGSSFLTGGLRKTNQARAYTYWDVSSPAFIKDHILCIPTILVSYTGDSLDTKAPLYKSMKAIDSAATRMIHLLGEKSVRHVTPVCGLEQEYFLVDREFYESRPDLKFTGRTLVGAPAVKRMELEDHYLSSVDPRVRSFMDDFNLELWRLGIYAQTEHPERAPSQFEIAAIYNTCNVTTDQNMLLMDVLQKTAKKHGLAALLHEKPYRSINGSGKHDNYSLRTDTGANLFSPGEKPVENIRFLVFVCAFIKAVDDWAKLVRLGGSCVGNDERLGGEEAPPVIMSIYMGDYIEGVLDELMTGKKQNTVKDELYFDPGFISGLSYLPRDNTDRNRTSPIAFTGNRFEFRMLGSSQSVALPNTILNAIQAKTLNEMADQLEGIKTVGEARDAALELCRDILKKHHRVLFSGDGYSKEWEEEASRRGLPSIKNYIDTLDVLTEKKTIRLFKELNILNQSELEARQIQMAQSYCSKIEIEKRTLVKMVRNEVMKAMGTELSEYGQMVQSAGEYAPQHLKNHLQEVSQLMQNLAVATDALEKDFDDIITTDDTQLEKGKQISDQIISDLNHVRTLVDHYESICDKKNYPFPTYDKMQFTY